MKIEWFGHSCFLLTSASGMKLLMDPFKAESYLNYPPVRATADIVTVSHEHNDHNYLVDITGKPEILRGKLDKKFNGIHVKGLSAFHDDVRGKERGINTIFCVNMDDINICHLGDLGHVLTGGEISQIGKVDVLLIPVGGVFTIDVDQAGKIVSELKPGITIPMHYKTEKCQFLQWSSDDFIKGKKGVKKTGSSEIEIKATDIPAEPEIIIMKYPG
ncbi:MAG: MBL fold metallo-hydrolase [Chloroflexi bacterium]|nr:MBL fold metallo-hydrolase [Chloroflexota bacterium]